MIDEDVRNGLVFDMPVFGNANDYSGNGYHGTVNGAVLTTDKYGRANRAYENSDGTKNIIIPDSSFLLNSPALAVSFWAKNYTLPAAGVNEYFFTFNNGVNTSFGMRIAGSILQMGGRSISTDSYGTSVYDFTTQNIWNHFVCEIDFVSKLRKLYLNGVLVTVSNPVSWSSNTYICEAGCNIIILGTLKGVLNGFKLFNRTIDLQEVIFLARR